MLIFDVWNAVIIICANDTSDLLHTSMDIREMKGVMDENVEIV